MSTDSSIDRIVFPLLKLLVRKVGDMAHCRNISLSPQLCNKFHENNLPPKQNNAQFLFFFLFLQFWRCPQLGMALGPDMVELLPVPVYIRSLTSVHFMQTIGFTGKTCFFYYCHFFLTFLFYYLYLHSTTRSSFDLCLYRQHILLLLSVSYRNILFCKLQALVYDILPSTTAVFSYAIGSRKLSANVQFFCQC